MDRIVEMPSGEGGTVVVFILHTLQRSNYPRSRLPRVGFDVDFNPLVRVETQWNTNMKNFDDGWMTTGMDRYSAVLNGDRLRGGSLETSFSVLKLADEKVGHRRVWSFIQSVTNVQCIQSECSYARIKYKKQRR